MSSIRISPDALRIFYDVQEAIRMNIPEEEILAMLYQHGCYFPQRQVEDVKKRDPPLGCMTRCWDYKGHMASSDQEMPCP